MHWEYPWYVKAIFAPIGVYEDLKRKLKGKKSESKKEEDLPVPEKDPADPKSTL
jgi:hypothetical protein